MCALLATACNAAFDLAPTISIDAGADFDEDGLFDANDNCPTVANANQVNADDDAFGDACDSCPNTASASVHDEDGDFVGDACDVCPGVPDFQDDRDADGVGDLCDPDLLAGPGATPRKHTRLLFEAFETIPPEWQASGIAWTLTDDSVAPVGPMLPTDRGLVYSTGVFGGSWLVVTGYRSTRLWVGEDQIAVGSDVAGMFVRCSAGCQTEQCLYSLEFGSGTTASIAGFIPLPRSRVFMGAASPYVGCRFEQGANLNVQMTSQPATNVSIAGSPNVRITYVEVIE
jgi:hypothetical protein